MSRHRVKTIGFDDDEYDEYDDEDEYNETGDGIEGDDSELTEEDREQLRLGTIEVQNLLQVLQQDGNAGAATISEKEIREALWHYYYDVDKAVEYLKNKKSPAQPKKPTKQAKQQTSKSKASGSEKVIGFPLPLIPSPPCGTRFSAADFFRDSPWLAIPPHRNANILVEPLYPRIGLLGGAPETGGKVSKLAALAAARKKRESEKNAASPTPGLENGESISSAQKRGSMSLHDRLAGGGRDRRTTESGDKRIKLGLKGRPGNDTPQKSETPSRSAQHRDKAEAIPKPNDDTSQKPRKDDLPTPESIRAPPSTFATIMVGEATPYTATASRYLPSSVNVMKVFGQDLAEAFNFAGPSPDDIALNARNPPKGAKSKPATGKSSTDKKQQGDIVDGVKQLSMEEPVKVKSKNLDVLAEYKKAKRKNAANFVVIGHVDAGKSTLMGRLLYDLKAIDQRTLDKYRREADRIGKGSFAFAWVLDQDAEERARGVTIDIATNKFETERTSFTILDAPGHRDFVPNMIAGASQADFAMLVIDAGTGNFEAGLKGQTKEHALLVRSMGVQKLVVAVNKMDAVKWSKDRFDEIEQQISSFLTTAGFQSKNIAFVPCSGLHGDNVTHRTEDTAASWYSGRILIEELESSESFSFSVDKPLRMTIGDIFRGGVQNPLSVSGRLDSGSLQMGDQLLTMPSAEKATIKSLEVDQEPSDWAVAGQNVVLHLTGIDPIHLRTGDVMCSPLSPIQNIASFTAKVLAFDHLTPMQVEVHRGRLHVPGRIIKMVATLDKSSGAVAKKKPKIVAPGTVARVVVEMEKAVPLEAPGRVVLRWSGETVAAGLLE